MSGRYFYRRLFVCLIALASLVVVTEASEGRIEAKKGKNKKNKKPSSGINVSRSSVSANMPTGSLVPNTSTSRAPSYYSNVPSPVDDLVIIPSPTAFNFIPPCLDRPYPSYRNINFNAQGPNQDIYDNLLLDPHAQDLLSSSTFSIPVSDRFALLPFIYFNQGRFDLFKLFLDKFDYSKVKPIILSGLIFECRNKREYFMTILESQHQVIFGSFRSFWDLMLQIETFDIDEDENESNPNNKFISLHQSVHWAFEHFASLIDEHQQLLTKHASLCIFNLLLDNPKNPFPESLLKEVLKLPGIELNVSIKGSCVALFTLGLPQLPEYYPKLILSDPRLNVNCIVPATNRSRGHIICHVPPLPLFWHALIYLNMRALKILWANKNLHVLPLIPSFFKLLRLALIFLFFHFWDGRSYRGERRLA